MRAGLILFLTTVVLSYGCANNAKKNKAPTSDSVSLVTKVNQPQVTVLLTDSAKLVKHLDSLQVAKLPYTVSDTVNPNWQTINLSEFKGKSLFNLRSKLHPKNIGGAGIDESANADSTFNLTDAKYNTHWLMISRKLHYFIILVDGSISKEHHFTKLVTLSYNLYVIDAMNVVATDPLGNDRFHGSLSTTIHKNLKLTLHYEYSILSDPQTFAWQVEETQNDQWRIDTQGHFKLISAVSTEQQTS